MPFSFNPVLHHVIKLGPMTCYEYIGSKCYTYNEPYKRECMTMPTDQPRINAVVEEPIYEAIETLAEKDGVSLSKKTRDLLLDALERVEDVGLEKIIEDRREAPGDFLSHEELKDRLDLS